MDRDIGKADDFLGSGVRGLRDLCDGEEHALAVPLRGAKGEAGEVQLVARFLPFDGGWVGWSPVSQPGALLLCSVENRT